MVLQRDEPVGLWGWGTPGQEVRVEMDGACAAATVGEDGSWRVELAARPAGGPCVIEVVSVGGRLRMEDVLFGDVWFASGQSNMAHRMDEGVVDAREPAGFVDADTIRHFDVPRRPSTVVENDLAGGEWRVAGPAATPGFSAVAHLFARAVQRREGIPIGIVHASWGGSSIEAWLRPEVLAALPHRPGPSYDYAAAGYGSLAEASDANERRIERVLEIVAGVDAGLARGVARVEFDDASWSVRAVPRWRELERAVFWMRRTVTVPAGVEGAAVLSLGDAGGRVDVFVDGAAVGTVENAPCRFEIAPGVLRAGDHVVAVRIANPWQAPFLGGDAEAFRLGNAAAGWSVGLFDGWRIDGSMEPALPALVAFPEIPSALHKGMIHPVLGVRKAGFLWYQGETNSFTYDQYGPLFRALVRDWRALSGQGELPFLFVQLAGFGRTSELPEEDSWVWMRETQTQAACLRQTGMAAAHDLGDVFDVHPKRKAGVAERLASEALRLRYGRDVVSRGPIARAVSISGTRVSVAFDHGEGMRAREGGDVAGFAVAGADRVFHRAQARIEGAAVVLACPAVAQPVAVRYAWARNPIANLINGAGLPAEPFRSDDWPLGAASAAP
jgi:sialate O-acetylesterase